VETINTYLENMFARLPKTAQVLRAKAELSALMEEKYRALKAQGSSEGEAVGVVITEFGNIDELMHELGIPQSDEEDSPPALASQAVDAYLHMKRFTAALFAVGVFLCIMAPAVLILCSSLGFWPPAWRPVSLFVMVAAAVSLFIVASMRQQGFEHIDESNFTLDAATTQDVEARRQAFRPAFIKALVAGVALCILSPIFALTMQSAVGGALVLITVACGVLVLVYFGIVNSGFDLLLRQREYAEENRRENRRASAIASVYWPLVTCAYLFWSFFYNAWGRSWIIWPVAGAGFAAISALFALIDKRKEGR
jgi:hypothetical protein